MLKNICAKWITVSTQYWVLVITQVWKSSHNLYRNHRGVTFWKMCIFCFLWNKSTSDRIILHDDWYLYQLHITLYFGYYLCYYQHCTPPCKCYDLTSHKPLTDFDSLRAHLEGEVVVLLETLLQHSLPDSTHVKRPRDETQHVGITDMPPALLKICNGNEWESHQAWFIPFCYMKLRSVYRYAVYLLAQKYWNGKMPTPKVIMLCCWCYFPLFIKVYKPIMWLVQPLRSRFWTELTRIVSKTNLREWVPSLHSPSGPGEPAC